MKTLLSLMIMVVASLSSFAEDAAAAQKTFLDDPFGDPMLPLYLVMAFVFVVMILVGLVGIYTIRILNVLTTQEEKEKAKRQGIVYVPKPTWFQKLSQQLNASVSVEQEKNIELDHSYDGIKELDNHLPPWWKWLFYGTIAWSVVYVIVFHFSDTLPLQGQEYEQEIAVAEEAARKLKASQPQEEIDISTLKFIPDQVIIERGKTVFLDNNCGSCHRNDAGGNTIGPNLTDEYWLHGGDVKEVFSTVKNGVVDKGMPAWGKALSPQNVRDVTFFIMSLQGTKPANAKGPQGEIFKQVEAVSDSVGVQASL